MTNLKQIIEAEMKEFENLFPKHTEIQRQFLAALLTHIAHKTLEAVEVQKDGYNCRECGSEGFNSAIEQVQEKVDAFLKSEEK